PSTLATETVALAAAHATLEVFAHEDVCGHLHRMGIRLLHGLHRLHHKHGDVLTGVGGIAEMCFLHFANERLSRDLARGCAARGLLFNQTQVIWRYLSGDPAAKQEFPLTEQVVDFWLDRWTSGLPPDEVKHADGVRHIEADIRAVAARVFKLHDAGQRDAAALIARRELVERL